MHKVNLSFRFSPSETAAEPKPMRKSSSQSRKLHAESNSPGFSLVEVVLALAVVAFAFVAILGLIPAGMNTFRQAINISVCSQIGQKVIADAFQADFDTLMTPPPPAIATTPPTAFQGPVRYYDEEGTEVPVVTVGTVPTNSIYTVNTKIDPKMTLPGATAVSYQTAVITVQVIYNPGRFSLASSDFSQAASSVNYLLVSSPHIPPQNVLTYYAHITRN